MLDQLGVELAQLGLAELGPPDEERAAGDVDRGPRVSVSSIGA